MYSQKGLRHLEILEKDNSSCFQIGADSKEGFGSQIRELGVRHHERWVNNAYLQGRRRAFNNGLLVPVRSLKLDHTISILIETMDPFKYDSID